MNYILFTILINKTINKNHIVIVHMIISNDMIGKIENFKYLR
jgi:hypothetical protein